MGFSIGSMVALKELVLFQRELLKKKLEARRKAREKAERLQRQRELAAKTAAAKEAARLARIALEKKQREDEKRRQEELAAEKEFINKIKGYRKKLGLKDEDALPPAEINFWKAVVDYENNQLKPTEHTKENYYKALFKYKSKPPATGTIKTTFTEADIKKIWDDYNATIKTYTYVKIYTDGVFKQFRMLREEQSIVELRTSKYGKEWSEWKTIAGNKDDISLLDLPSSIAWERTQVLTGGASFGKAIACTEKQLIVGEPTGGKATLWEKPANSWTVSQNITDVAGFGASVALSERYKVVGNPTEKKAEVYESAGSFNFSNEKTTGRFKVKSDAYLNAPAASTAGFLGYTVADDDGVNYSQIAQNLDDNAVYVRHFSAGNNGAWSSSDIAAFKQKTNLNTRSNQNDYVQRYYSTNQVNSKLMVGFCFQQHDDTVTYYEFTGHLFIEVETNKIYYHCYENGGANWVTEISDKLKIDEFKKMMSFTNRVLPYVSSTTVEAVNGFKATVNAQGTAGSVHSDVNTFITLEENNVKKSFQLTVDDEAIVYLNTKTGGAWSGWSNITGTRPADPIQLKTYIKSFKKLTTLTGGVSFGKMVACNNGYVAVAEPKSNKVILNNFSGITGWFKIPQTKYDGIPDNANGYTGYYIKGGHYQLVRPVGTTDTYTKYRGGAWVKNGTWGGVFWYLGSKIGFEIGDNQWHQVGQRLVGSSDFGYSVRPALDGNTFVLGAPNSNYAEVYEYKNNQWVLKGQRLTGNGSFGISVDISHDGNTIVVGAYYSNYAEVYEYKNNRWVLKGQRLTGTDRLGTWVTISGSGNILLLSSYSTYLEVYEYKNNQWGLRGKRLAGNGYFNSISKDGSTIAYSVSNNVVVYEYVSNSWTKKGNAIATNQNRNSVSLSNDGNAISIIKHGIGQVYEYKNKQWKQKGGDTRNSSFSWSTALSSDASVVTFGAYGSNYAEVYEYKNNQWVLKGQRLTGTGAFGLSCGISSDGSLIICGASNGRYIEVYRFNKTKQLYLDTKDGKHYYGNKEVKDDVNFNSIMETVAPLPTLPDTIPQANRNLKLTNNDIQEQPKKTGAYVSLLGTGTATTPITSFENIIKTEYLNPNDSISMNEKELLIASKVDKKAYVYDITTDPLTTTPAKTIKILATYGDSCTLGSDYITVGSKALSQVNVYSFAGTLTNEIEGHRDYGFSLSSNIGHLLTGSETANYADIHRLKISEEENKLLAKRLLSLEQEEKDRVAKEAARQIAEIARIAAIKDEEKRKAAQAKEDARQKAEEGRLKEANRIKTAYDDAIREVTGSSTRRQTFNTNSLWAISEILRKKGIQFNLSTLVST